MNIWVAPSTLSPAHSLAQPYTPLLLSSFPSCRQHNYPHRHRRPHRAPAPPRPPVSLDIHSQAHLGTDPRNHLWWQRRILHRRPAWSPAWPPTLLLPCYASSQMSAQREYLRTVVAAAAVGVRMGRHAVFATCLLPNGWGHNMGATVATSRGLITSQVQVDVACTIAVQHEIEGTEGAQGDRRQDRHAHGNTSFPKNTSTRPRFQVKIGSITLTH